jgi:hypothetical protein
LSKRSKKGSTERGYTALTLLNLRGVADRIQEGIVQCAKIGLFVRYRARPEELPEKYREFARFLPPKLPIPKPIALAQSPQDLWRPSAYSLASGA